MDIFPDKEIECYELEAKCPHCGDDFYESVLGKLRADGTEYTQIERVDFNEGTYFVNLRKKKPWN